MPGASSPQLTAEGVIEKLGLEPHPEGGHYAETWRHAPASGRGSGTCIYYLLRRGETSAWHRIDADEIGKRSLVAQERRRARHVRSDGDRPDRQLIPRQQIAGKRQQ